MSKIKVIFRLGGYEKSDEFVFTSDQKIKDIRNKALELSGYSNVTLINQAEEISESDDEKLIANQTIFYKDVVNYIDVTVKYIGGLSFLKKNN